MKGLNMSPDITMTKESVSPARQRKSIVDPGEDYRPRDSHANSREKQTDHHISDNFGRNITDPFKNEHGRNRVFQHSSLANEILRVLLLTSFFLISCLL